MAQERSYYPTPSDYFRVLERDGTRWVRPRPGSYADLTTAGLLPRGL